MVRAMHNKATLTFFLVHLVLFRLVTRRAFLNILQRIKAVSEDYTTELTIFAQAPSPSSPVNPPLL